MCHLTNSLNRYLPAWPLLLRIGLSCGLMGALLWRQDWAVLRATFAGMELSGWFMGLAVFLMSQVVSAVRWWSFAQPLGLGQRFTRIWRLYFEGMFFSLCLPSSIGGDVIKALRISPTAAGRMLGACSVVADRLAGLCAVLIIGLAALTGRELGLSGGAAFAVGGVYYLIACLVSGLGLAGSNWLARRLSPESRLGRALTQLAPYHHRPAVFWRGIFLGVIVQGLNVAGVICLGAALGIDLPPAAYCAVVPLVALATTLPISLNGVGVREGAMVLLLREYGIATEVSTTLALVWFTVQVAAGLIGGVVYAVAPKLTYAERGDAIESENAALQRAA